MSYQGRQINRVQWFEGMLLLPQHFQQADQRVDQLFHIHMSNSIGHYWGINTYQIDEADLISGKITFLSLEAILPDGTYYLLTPEDSARLSTNFTKVALDTAADTVTVYLALPKYIPGRSTVETDLPRFISTESNDTCDENTGIEGDQIPVLKPNVSLIVGEEPSSRYVSFPILRIKKGDNGYALDERFTAPQLKLSQMTSLGQMCNELTKKIREKIAFLCERLHDQTDGLISGEAENAVKGLTFGLLPFEAILRAGNSHPFYGFTALCQIAAAVSTLQMGQMPPSFAPYDHNELYQTYAQVIEYIYNILARIQEGYSVIPFLAQDRVFKLPLRRTWQADKLIIGAKAPKGMSLAELTQWIGSSVVATDSHVTSVREKRILGAPRRILEAENEMKLMPAKDMVLFSVDGIPEFVNFEETLNIFNVADNPIQRPIELVLYVPKKGS